ncbi:SDR family NAD(P)-dependent oxidoreductase [Rhodococcus sp. NPDC057529]|uniref:SDR family NAD(P)-dependent oxidoreductase n=1 Tax=Rhodococcus sp. NPDC057529 TaxID=3346158 RepID=UPI003672AB3F
MLITGAATGIGRAPALSFAARGAAVVIGDVDARAEQKVSEIAEAGGQATFVRADVSRADQVEALVARTADTYVSLDVAFNNTGVLPPTAALAEQTVADWDRVLGVDVTGVFLCLEYELTHMVAAGAGSIVNTASVAGLIADPGMAPYVAATHAVVGLTKAAALGLRRVRHPHQRRGTRNSCAPR